MTTTPTKECRNGRIVTPITPHSTIEALHIQLPLSRSAAFEDLELPFALLLVKLRPILIVVFRLIRLHDSSVGNDGFRDCGQNH